MSSSGIPSRQGWCGRTLPVSPPRETAGRARPEQAGLGPLSRRRAARTPTLLLRARALLCRGHRSSSGRSPGHAGRGRTAGWTRDPGTWAFLWPFLKVWTLSYPLGELPGGFVVVFFNISFYRTIKKKKKKNGGAERGPFRGGQHFSVLTPTWQPSGFSAAPAPKPSSELGRSAWAAGTFLSSEVCSFLGSLSGECDSAFLLHTFLHGFHHLF